jgi:hypothetical protein
MDTSDVETLINDEKVIRKLSTPLIHFKSNSDPNFIWFGIFDQSGIIFEYPSRPLNKLQSEISDFLSGSGSGFCFPTLTPSSKRPYVFKIMVDLQEYYGICCHVKEIQSRVMVTTYPFFHKYIAALQEIDKLDDTDRYIWLENFYQPRTSCSFDLYRDKILKWGLIEVLSKIPITSRIFKLILTAIILERQIILISPDLYLLSAAVLCFPLLISPFTYQCHEIPVVPLTLLDLLATPTPYIAGVSQFPSNSSELSSSVIIIDLEQGVDLSPSILPEDASHLLPKRDKVRSDESLRLLPKLPNFDELIMETIPFLRFNSDRRYLYLAVVASLFEDFFSELFNIEMVRKYRICRRNQNEKISIFLMECFLESVDINHRSFYREFFQTQIFTQAINYILQEIDARN